MTSAVAKFDTLQEEQVYANQLLHKWILRLRLYDWRILLEVVPADGIDGDGEERNGRVRIFVARKEAKIWLRRSEDRKPNEVGRTDSLECSLVHELLHLILQPLQVPKHHFFEEEAACQILAEAFTG